MLRQASAGQPLEDLAVALNDRMQTLPERLVSALACDVLRDRLAHGVGDADPLRSRNRLQLIRLLR